MEMRNVGGACAVLITALAMTSTAVCAESGSSISWGSSYRDALLTAQSNDKPLLIKITSSTCSQCERLDNETMTADQVVSVVNDRYVSLALDATRDAELVSKLRVESVPATLIVAPDRRILRRIEGFQDASSMNTHLVGALSKQRRAPAQRNFNSQNWSGSS